jgi:hypothetical protein
MWTVLITVVCCLASPIATTLSWQVPQKEKPLDRTMPLGPYYAHPPNHVPNIVEIEIPPLGLLPPSKGFQEHDELRRRNEKERRLIERQMPDHDRYFIERLVRAIKQKQPMKVSDAWQKLVARGPDALPLLLEELDETDVETANWVRTAFEAITEKAVREKQKLPIARIQEFLMDTDHQPRARRLAYEWLCRTDPTTSEKWLPKLLNDPSPELRRDAIAVGLEKAEKLLTAKEDAKAKEAFQKLLTYARDADQVEIIAKHLDKFAVKVDFAKHFGFITSWQVIGPFDNTDEKGFGVAYPPEKGIDLKAKLAGKQNAELAWQAHRTELRFGMVDLNQAIGKHMAAVGYAYVALELDKEQPVDIRVGSDNAVQVFVNGKRVITHEQYHHGHRMDQFVAKVWFKTGRNEILVKVCQNHAKEIKAQVWSFQLRVCDSAGIPVAVKVVP